jgi:hypothetical protein
VRTVEFSVLRTTARRSYEVLRIPYSVFAMLGPARLSSAKPLRNKRIYCADVPTLVGGVSPRNVIDDRGSYRDGTFALPGPFDRANLAPRTKPPPTRPTATLTITPAPAMDSWQTPAIISPQLAALDMPNRNATSPAGIAPASTIQPKTRAIRGKKYPASAATRMNDNATMANQSMLSRIPARAASYDSEDSESCRLGRIIAGIVRLRVPAH